MDLTTQLASCLLAFIGGAIAHELTHYLLAKMAGVSARIVWIRNGWRSHPEVRFQSTGWPVDTIVRLGPLCVGLFVAGLWVGLNGLTSPGTVWIAAWVPYTLFGGLADYSAAISQRESSPRLADVLGLPTQPAWIRRAWGRFALMVISFTAVWALFVFASAFPGVLWYPATSLASGLGIAMGVGMAMGMPEEVLPR